jgi:hypothetical protein
MLYSSCLSCFVIVRQRTAPDRAAVPFVRFNYKVNVTLYHTLFASVKG